jgi:hypothetical protein
LINLELKSGKNELQRRKKEAQTKKEAFSSEELKGLQERNASLEKGNTFLMNHSP